VDKSNDLVGSSKKRSALENYLRLKLQEFYWTLCTLVGLKHLHDGSKAEAPVAAKPAVVASELSKVKAEEEERIGRLIEEARNLGLSRTSEYLLSHRADLVLVAVRERTTPEPSKLPSPFVYAMQ
jgi:hypothetical protein